MTRCTGGTCPDALFVTYSSNPWDWNTPSITTLWNDASRGVNDPCPSGYRVPAQSELQALDNSFTPNTSQGAMNSPVRMPLIGSRSYSTGTIWGGTQSYYWSSTLTGTNACFLIFDPSQSSVGNNMRDYGYGVRCIVQ